MLCRVVVFALSLFYCLSTSADTETAIASPPAIQHVPLAPSRRVTNGDNL